MVVEVGGCCEVCVSSINDSLREPLVACDHLLERLRGSSAFVPTGGCFPCPEGEPQPRSRFALPEVSLPEDARGDLAFELRRWGATPCPGLQTVRFPYPQVGRRTEPDCRSRGSFSQTLPEESGASLEDHLWLSRHLGPEGRCPRSGPAPGVVQLSKQRQAGEPALAADA